MWTAINGLVSIAQDCDSEYYNTSAASVAGWAQAAHAAFLCLSFPTCRNRGATITFFFKAQMLSKS